MTFPTLKRAAATAGLLALSASSAFAAETSGDGNTAWMMTSTLLVLLMSLPGSPCSMAASFAPRTCCR